MDSFTAKLYTLGFEDCESFLSGIENTIKEESKKGGIKVNIDIPKFEKDSEEVYFDKVCEVSSYIIYKKFYSRRILDEDTGLYSLEISWESPHKN